jgi:uncharacterized protein YcnI
MIIRRSGLAFGVAALSLFGPPSAFAHVTLEKPEALSGAGYKAVLRVSHGCEGSPTIALSVTIPEGMVGAKPMPKPGWTLDIVKGLYAKAYPFYHGTIAEGAKTITWSKGSLPDDEYDEFVVSGLLSDSFAPGTLVVFPVVQTCAVGANAWTETPKPGGDAKMPAPVLTITGPAARGSEHHHH